MITALFLPAEETQPVQKVEIDAEDVDAMQQIVGGRFQALNLVRPPASLFLNDSGNIDGLPVNRRATYLLWLHAKAHLGQTVIGGDALLTGMPDGRGNTKSMPAELETLLCNTEAYHVEVLPDKHGPWVADMLRFTEWADAYEYALMIPRLFGRIRERSTCASWRPESHG